MLKTILKLKWHFILKNAKATFNKIYSKSIKNTTKIMWTFLCTFIVSNIYKVVCVADCPGVVQLGGSSVKALPGGPYKVGSCKFCFIHYSQYDGQNWENK